MYKIQFLKITTLFLFILLGLSACNGKLPGGDARKNPSDPKERIKKNLEEGRGFRLMDIGENRSGTFDFASSNELWRATLDTIDFMPLVSVNYSGGIIITDWYSSNDNLNESIKISIRFLTNEIRSDSLDVKVFNRICKNDLFNCKITQSDGIIVTELKKNILKLATKYKSEDSKKAKK